MVTAYEKVRAAELNSLAINSIFIIRICVVNVITVRYYRPQNKSRTLCTYYGTQIPPTHTRLQTAALTVTQPKLP